MQVRILGPIEVISGETPVELPSGRVRELLVRLVVAGPGAVGADQLAADLWPDGDHRTVTSTVRTYVGRLRAVLPEDVVVTRVGGYGLDRARVTVDADAFEDEVRRARTALRDDPAGVADRLDLALGSWRGPALGEVADRDWASAVARRLEGLHLDALELHAEARLLADDDPAALATRLAELTHAHPTRERLWRHRILALYRGGRQAEALDCYQELRRHLREELGIEPSTELRELERAVLAQDPALDARPTTATPSRTPAPPPPGTRAPTPPTRTAPDAATTTEPRQDPLPHRTSLVGREVERDELLGLVAAGSVVTVTGPAGVGKSRLATEVAAHTDAPATLVPLASCTDGTAAAEAVAEALGVVQRGGRELVDHLVDALAGTGRLLVLDNCEHLVTEVAALVDTIVARAPSAAVLATSREPLGARGELVRPLAPLDLPEEDASPDEVRAADAVRLFEARARVVAPRFEVDDAVAPTVARICRQLDGLPLAIELAAARVRMLTPADIELRLHERFTLLTGGRTSRHETLRAAIDWSHELLDDDGRRALRRLSTFVSTFDVRGAVAVVDAPDEGAVIDVLAGLIDRSLLAVETHGDHVRYRMLESVRAFGREQLEAHGELVATRTRHADQLVQAAVHAGELLHGPREAEGHRLLEEVRPDLRAAVEWCVLAGHWTSAARVVAAIPWERVGRWVQADVTGWAVRLLEEDPDLDVVLSARVHGVAAVGHWLAGDVEAMRTTAERALALAEGLPDDVYVPVALAVAWSYWEAGDLERATALYLPLATPGLGQRVRPDVAAYCLAGMVMGMVEAGLMDASQDAVELGEELVGAALELAGTSGCPAALSLAHLAEAYRQLDSDPVAAEAALRAAASVPGLALPSWALHARCHLARLHAEELPVDALATELGHVLVEGLAAVDELHLRHLGGFAGGALVMAGVPDLAPTLHPLTVHAFTVAGGERWRRDVIERLELPTPEAPPVPLAGGELEQAIRTAIDDLRVAAGTGAAPVTGVGAPR